MTVDPDTPPPPGHLLRVQVVGLHEGALLFVPDGPLGYLHPVFLLMEPGDEQRHPAVLSGHRPVPQILELVVAVGGGLDDHQGVQLRRYRLHHAVQDLVLVSLPEGKLREMHVVEGLASAHAVVGGDAADRGHEPRPAPLLRWVPGGILKHQFLGVGVLAHRLELAGQVIEKQLIHPEELGGRVIPVGHDQGLHQLSGGAVLKHHPLGDGGESQLPGLEDQDTGWSACLPLPFHRVQQHLLGRLWPQSGDLPLLGADLQKLRDVYLRVPQSRHRFVSFRKFLINFGSLDILSVVIV